MTEADKKKRWPNVVAMTAGLHGIPDDISDEEARSLDTTEATLTKPEAVEGMTKLFNNIVGRLRKNGRR